MRRGDLRKLSEILSDGSSNREKTIKEYRNYVETLLNRNNISEEEEEIIEDFFDVVNKRAPSIMGIEINTETPPPEAEKSSGSAEEASRTRIISYGQAELGAGKTSRQVENPGTFIKSQGQAGPSTEDFNILLRQAARINLNELVAKPEIFYGYKPRPRQWIEAYEEAYLANEWPDELAIKYFPTFLRGDAKDWWTGMVAPKIKNFSTWTELKACFIKHYLGDTELRTLKKQFQDLAQGPRDLATNFIPRAYRLARLISPRMDEAEAVDKIIDKLRPELITGLGLQVVDTIEDLVDLCARLENKEKRAEERKLRNQRKDPKQQYEGRRPERTYAEAVERTPVTGGRPSNHTPIQVASQSKIRCYRCNDRGHYSRECKATLTIDGKPIKERQQREPEAVKIVESEDPSSNLELNTEATCEDTIYGINVTEEDCTKTELCLNRSAKVTEAIYAIEGDSKKVMYEFMCNGIMVKGLIDTGAYFSVIDSDIVDTYGWKVDLPAPVLQGAGNNTLNCIGTCKLNISLRVGKRSRATDLHVAVVKRLGTELICGLELLSLFKVMIDVENRQISFKETKRGTGIRTSEEVILPPKTQKIIVAKVNEVGTILTCPMSPIPEMLVANSIGEVDKGRIQLAVCNIGKRKIALPADTQVATYEKIDSAPEKLWVGEIVKLENSTEIVKVGKDLNETQIDDLYKLINHYRQAFALNGKIGSCNGKEFEHKIELLPDAKPINESLRRRPQVHVETTRKLIKDMLKDGIIEESKSPWSSPYLLVKKKTGDYRLCIDFRKVNAMTKKMAYPLPNIDDCLDTLAGKVYFSLIDFHSGFWQVPLSVESKEITAFKTEDGQFQFRRLPFGLTNAPASFQKMVNAVLGGLRGVNLQVFIDDVCIASSTWQEHLSMLEKVLSIVITSNLKLKPSKCTFGAKSVIFLGHKISIEGIRQDPEKAKALISLPPPRDVAGIRRMIGMFGYYRKFIPNFAARAEPLTKQLKKNAKFSFGEKEKEAFDYLIKSLANDTLLAHFNHTDPLMLKTDASKEGVAAMLFQKQKNEWRLVTCCSRRLNESEGNYGITDLEGLAVIYAVSKLRSYLLGKRFTILTDHSALKVWNSRDPSSPRLKRWALILSEFDFEIAYQKGDLHKDVDCLSRAPIDSPDRYIEDRIFTLIIPADPDEWVVSYENEDCREIVDKAKKREDEFSFRNNIVYKQDKLYVPPSKVMDILKRAHDSEIAGHGGINQTLFRLRGFWWKDMEAETRRYVANCTLCQARKIERSKPAGSMKSFEIFETGHTVAVDYLGPITQTVKLNKYILVAIDCFSRLIFAKATADTTAEVFIDFLVDYCSVFGTPRVLLSDNAKTFTCQATKKVAMMFGISQKFSAPMHSQGNAIVERAIQSIQTRLNLTLKTSMMDENNWDVVLPIAILSLNTSVNKSIGYSPFEVVFGKKHTFEDKLTCPQQTNPHDIHLNLLKRQLDEIRSEAIELQNDAQKASRSYYEQRHRTISYDKDDLVWAKTRARNSKLADNFEGPFEVLERQGDIYKLRERESGKEIVRHVSKLKPYLNQDTISTIRTMPQRRERRSNPIAIIACILVVLVNLGASQTLREFTLTRADFVTWTPTNNYVIESRREYLINLYFRNPCEKLHTDFKDDTDVDHELIEGKKVCDERYLQEIINPLETLSVKLGHKNVPQRQPRSVVAFFAALFITNIIDTIFDDSAQKDEQRHAELAQLNRKLNYTTEGVIELSKQHQYLQEKVNQLYTETREWSRRNIRLSVAISFTMAKLTEKAAALKDFKFDLINTRTINLKALNRLLDTEMFESIVPETIRFASFGRNYKGGYVLHFFAHTFNTEMSVLKVEAMPHWSDIAVKPVMLQYGGPTHILYNATNNCILGLHDLSRNSLAAPCKVQNGLLGNLNIWTRGREGNPFANPAPTVHIEVLPDVHVYCFGRRINIEDTEMDCPPYPFSLKVSTSWNTTDVTFHPYEPTNVSFGDIIPQIRSRVSPRIHVETGDEYIPSTVLKNLYNITSTLETERTKSYILNTPVGGVSYASFNKILFATIGLSIGLAICFWRKSHITGRRRHNKTINHLKTALQEHRLLAIEASQTNDLEEENNQDKLNEQVQPKTLIGSNQPDLTIVLPEIYPPLNP